MSCTQSLKVFLIHFIALHCNLINFAGTCPELDDPANGTVVESGRMIGFNATYTCNHGFILDGLDTRTCEGPDGTWSGNAPACVPSKYIFTYIYIICI